MQGGQQHVSSAVCSADGGRAGDGTAGGAGRVAQAGGQVDRVSHDGVLDPVPAAEQRRGHLAGTDADAEPERLQSLAGPDRVQRFLAGVHLGGGRQGPRLMPVERFGSAEDGHHRVADVLHHGAAVSQHGIVHGLAVLVELRRQPAGGAVSAIAV